MKKPLLCFLIWMIASLLAIAFSACREPIRNSLRDSSSAGVETAETSPEGDPKEENSDSNSVSEKEEGNGSEAQGEAPGEDTETADINPTAPPEDEENPLSEDGATGDDAAPPVSTGEEDPFAEDPSEPNADPTEENRVAPDPASEEENGDGDDGIKTDVPSGEEGEEPGAVLCASCGAVMRSGGSHEETCPHYAYLSEEPFLQELIGRFGGVLQNMEKESYENAAYYRLEAAYMTRTDYEAAVAALKALPVSYVETTNGACSYLSVEKEADGKLYSIETFFDSDGELYTATLSAEVLSA